MSERFFEGDLHDGKGQESCILTAGAELVAIKSLASLRDEFHPLLPNEEFRSPD